MFDVQPSVGAISVPAQPGTAEFDFSDFAVCDTAGATAAPVSLKAKTTSFSIVTPEAEIEFESAMIAYKKRSGRLFPTWTEVFEVLRELGYSKA